MKLRLILYTSMIIASPISSLIQPLEALASQTATFRFNKHIGEVWVGDITVLRGNIRGTTINSSNCGGQDNACAGPFSSSWQGEGTRISVPLGIPSCPNQYHAEGSVTVKYTNGNAYITRIYSISADNEGRSVNPSWDVRGYYGNPSQGRINVDTSVQCVYHGVNNRGGPTWAPWNW